MKKTLCILLALCMLSGLAACGGNAPAPAEEPAPAAEEPTAEEPAEEAVPEVAYRVTVEDPDGYPVPGAAVELRDDAACIRGETDENGEAEFTARDTACTVRVLSAPEACAATDEEFRFPEGERELRITLELSENYENLAPFTDVFGNPVPGTFRFETRDLDGNPVRLADVFAGHRVTMVNFWNIGCKPCIKEMPELEKMNNSIQELDCQVIGICTVGNWGDDDERVKEILEEKGVTYTTLFAREMDARLPSVDAVPVSYCVDRMGKPLTEPTFGAPTEGAAEFYTRYLEYALSVLEGTETES